MIKRSLLDYYPLVLQEGEGAGTAYEYYVKRRVIHRLLGQNPQIKRVLIGGLPEKYGLSLDFILLAQDLGAEALVVDEREDRLSRLQEALRWAEKQGLINPGTIKSHLAEDLTCLPQRLASSLFISCEVLQRLNNEDKKKYLQQTKALAPQTLLFVPNADNSQHAGRSGLQALSMEDLRELATEAPLDIKAMGFLDLPPFPPGIKREDSQREEVLNNNRLRLILKGVEKWGLLEGFIPGPWRRRLAHMVYLWAAG